MGFSQKFKHQYNFNFEYQKILPLINNPRPTWGSEIESSKVNVSIFNSRTRTKVSNALIRYNRFFNVKNGGDQSRTLSNQQLAASWNEPGRAPGFGINLRGPKNQY